MTVLVILEILENLLDRIFLEEEYAIHIDVGSCQCRRYHCGVKGHIKAKCGILKKKWEKRRRTGKD